MKSAIFMLAVVVAMLCSCAGGEKAVEFAVAQNYFVRNDVPAALEQLYVVKSQAEMDSVFGMAAFMGKGGEPTRVDFGRSFVIGKVMPVTDVETDVKPLSLTQSAPATLTLKYAVKQGAKMGYSMRPCFLIVVDKKYADCKIEELR